MGIDAYMKRIAKKDTAVYWTPSTLTTSGSQDYNIGTEINCLWKEDIKLLRDSTGREIVSKAIIYVTIDLEEHGFLFHGKLDDLTTAQKSDPKEVASAYEIMVFKKVPSINLGGQFNRQAVI